MVGADSVPKKLGNSSISSVTLVSSDTSDESSTFAVATYVAQEDGEYVACIAGHGAKLTTDGKILLNTGEVNAGGAHTMTLSIIMLNKNNQVTVKGWSNARVYKLDS